MAKNMNLTAQDVYSKEFHVDLKGYAPAEVDEFLDQVIEDYQEYDEKIEELSQAVTRYEQETMRNGMVNAGNSDQVDILKRISRLEQAVFHNNQNKGQQNRGPKNKRKYNNAHPNNQNQNKED